MFDITDNSKENIEAAEVPTEFYKFAYTSLLRRYVVTSCDNVIASGEALKSNIKSLRKDIQELVYNCTSDELDSMMKELEAPTACLQKCLSSLNDALEELKCYKAKILTSENL